MLTAPRFSTHLAPLAGCVAQTEGPVIELGAGLFSTSALHCICQGRELVTADSDAEWLDRLRYLENDWHRFVVVDDWDAFSLLDREWAVALVDQSPGDARLPSVERLRRRSALIVVHDTQGGFEPDGTAIAPFRHRADFFEPGVGVRTTVISDLRPIPVRSTDLLANHVSLGMQFEDVAWRPTSRWTTGLRRELPALPRHFNLVGNLDLGGKEVDVQALFRTESHDDFFWGPLKPEATVPPPEALIVSEALIAVGNPDWGAITELEIRARSDAEGTVALSGLDLKVLPPIATGW